MKCRYLVPVVFALLAVAQTLMVGFTHQAAAQTVEQFYKGRMVSLLIPSAPGGGNDFAARLVAQNLGRYIPGNPRIVPQNLSNGSGLILANRLYSNSERDGSVIAILERAIPQLALQGDPNVRFDPLKFVWLGSLSSYANDSYLFLVNATSQVRSIEDLKTNPASIQVGAATPGISNLTFAILAKELFGLNIKIVRGYGGTSQIFLAMQRGEVDGQMVGLGAAKAGQSNLWSEGRLRPILQFARSTRLPELPDVPVARELIKDPKDLLLLEFAEEPFFMALPFLAPPEVPADRAKALQDAFMAMTKDADFLAGAQKLGLDVSPINATALRTLLEKAAATPKDIIQRYNELTGFVP